MNDIHATDLESL